MGGCWLGLAELGWAGRGKETGRKKEACFVFFFSFCIYLRVKSVNLYTCMGENLTHTHTHSRREDTVSALGEYLHLHCRQEEWILFQA